MRRMPIRSRAMGISLVEMLISLVIGLVVVGAVLVSIIGSGKAGRFQSAYAQMNEDAQIGLSILSRDIQMAGYSQPTALTSSGGTTPTLTLTSTALGTSTFVFGCDTGFADPRATTLVCGTATTPAFEVTYEADKDNTVLTGGAPSDCLGNGIPGVAPFIAHNRYFISATSSGRPELYCASDIAASAQPLIENVEGLKIWYGVSVAANPTQVVRYVTASDISALGAVLAAAEWGQVIGVRVCLVVRSAEPVLNEGDDTLTYLDCDSASQTSNDRYLRRAYFTTASLRVRMPL
jgi:type IV pilus assembly protein PilW